GFCEADLEPYLSMHYAPEPDLFIRTGGEKRISNFLLWQLAYTELYFTDTLWPAFDRAALDAAIQSYQQRERRFGRTSDQLKGDQPKGERQTPDQESDHA
ncbi:MAG TPA: undecaprenyl diphosphate synthase family protein, partial [Pseudomonadales bacterium]